MTIGQFREFLKKMGLENIFSTFIVSLCVFVQIFESKTKSIIKKKRWSDVSEMPNRDVSFCHF